MRARWRGVVLCLVLPVAGVRADCLLDQGPATTNDTLSVLFPNWKNVIVLVSSLTVCDNTTCAGTPTCDIVGLTIFNYGNATGPNDLAQVYFSVVCAAKGVTVQTMTYAGIWTGTTTNPAWTWAGDVPYSGGDPMYQCSNTAMLWVYADIGACPTDGAEVTMGIAYNDVISPATPGGLMDACGCQVPNYDQARTGRQKFIRYVTKTTDKTTVAPGDTVAYTIYYGRPGAAITNFIVMDSLPADTHYIAGSGVPAPDPGWDPDPGPPLRLRWTLPGGSTAGGPTGEVRFQASVDWGNGEAFEPGSGDLAAREGARLDNTAAVEFLGSGCAPVAHLSPPVGAIVRRYLMWKVADQDLLFAPRVGQPDDEIIYSIFIRNESSSKTWWKLSVWDTVPAELDVWNVDTGFPDQCLGAWTMTPTGGCAVGAPNWTVGAGKTLLTWTLDLEPGQTLELKWKAKVRVAGVTAGATAISKVSVMALGATGRVDGTGNARLPRTFIHLAPIVLRTTYFSYVGQSSSSNSCGDLPAGGLKINFFPLNRATNFELRKLQYAGAATFAAVGGKSASITAMQGTCSGGFADGGYGGCGPERSPAQYFMPPPCLATPNAILFKLTANAPVLWMLMPEIGAGGDAHTYLPSTSLHHAGFCLYSYRRCLYNGATCDLTAGYGESWVVFNTSVDEYGVAKPALGTTAHIFKWDPTLLSWSYVRGSDVDPTSLWMPFQGCVGNEEGQYRIISSDARLLVYQGYGTIGDPTGVPYGYNEHGGLVPTAENGLNTSRPGGPGTFYIVCYHDADSNQNMMIGNCDPAVPSVWRLYHYRSRYPGQAVQGIPPSLAGNSGVWDYVATRTTDAGLAGPVNPFISGFIGERLANGTGGTANSWKIEWQSGGTISVNAGANMMRSWAGGRVIHSADGRSTGQDFWFHQYSGPATHSLLFFAHSAGMAVQAVSTVAGFSATYTSDGPDQCIGFLPLPGTKVDSVPWRIRLLAGGTQGELIGMYHQEEFREKFFTAPFVSTGVHYEIIAPPTVFSGQPFWITVVVVLNTGTTKIDYCGSTSFTSTDPLARIEGAAMDGYNFTWSSSSAVPACSAAPDENGVRVFVNVTMYRLGLQSLVANDTSDGSINGVTAINVTGANIQFFKQPKLTVAASGDTVQFKICWSNYSSASGFSFVVTDAVPIGTSYLPEAGVAGLDCGTTNGTGMTVAYSTVATPTPPAAASFTTANPVAGTQWLRWSVPIVGVGTSGCACFRIRVN